MKLLAADILAARILVVDDQEPNVVLLKQILAEAGYRNITTTTDPKEVSSLHRWNTYDLILLDLQMPEMDGFQVMDALKNNARESYLPVIVLTAQPGHKLRALQAGAKDFISKPFDLTEVRTRIHNMLEVRLLYKQLDDYSKALEQTVRDRTVELRDSEARYRALTELATDWYWEQDESGAFTKVSGPVLEMLGISVDGLREPNGGQDASVNKLERQRLLERITARQPFLDLEFTQTLDDGTRRLFRVSGEPMFDQACRFIGYRGIGVEVTVT